MKLHHGIVLLFLLCSFAAYAQPRWSPEIRSKREVQWMADSLHITKEQENKISPLSLEYQLEMDKAAVPENEHKAKIQHQLMRKKDADFKAILNKRQYERYYNRELLIRQRENIQYDDNRRPY